MTVQSDYVRDPAEIYRRSFAIVRQEADLDRFAPLQRDLVIRMIHACGMIDITDDLVLTDNAVPAGRAALASGAPIVCDVAMVQHGIIRRNLHPDTKVLCAVNSQEARQYADRHGTTRSAAGIVCQKEFVDGGVVVIGNAPTALFQLLDMIEQGEVLPALIVALPVGFVGAVESKAKLVENSASCPFVTLAGRRGGSALAAAAINALSGGLQ